MPSRLTNITAPIDIGASAGTNVAGPSHICPLHIEAIRTDGDTQQRCFIDKGVVRNYAELMEGGIRFPPVTVWYDGTSFWLSDGFHRLAAARLLTWSTISAAIHNGSMDDARWDSYQANSDHGLRRTKRDVETVVKRAINHPRAAQMSNVEIAKHLNMPEATLRRWRKRLSSSCDEDSIKVVTRGASTYAVDTIRIGNTRPPRRAKSLKALGSELSEMQDRSSPEIRRFLTVLTKWMHGSASADHCLRAIEQIVADLKGKSSHGGAT